MPEHEGLAENRRSRREFLSEVREVCRLRWAKDPANWDVEIAERTGGGGRIDIDHLVVSCRRGYQVQQHVVGVHEGRVTIEMAQHFLSGVRREYGARQRPELVCRDSAEPQDRDLSAVAPGVTLWRFEDYQQVWDCTGYLQRQTAQLQADLDYPLDGYVEKRWASQMLKALDTTQPCFLLALGDFGTGKTFLMRKVAYELARAGHAPVLIEISQLENAHTLDEVLAQHMAGRDDGFDLTAFRYLLRRGRVVLLLDGFDELASCMAEEHWSMLKEAAEGSARVVVASHPRCFAIAPAMPDALAVREVELLPGSRTLHLLPLVDGQRREFALAALRDEARAGRLLHMLGAVEDPHHLLANPAVLALVISGFAAGLVTEDQVWATADRSGKARLGNLYKLLLDAWLMQEERLEAVTKVALALWHTGQRSVTAQALGAAADAISDLPLPARHGAGRFGFVHPSVMEWLVAAHIARAFDRQDTCTIDESFADHELTPLMADFLRDLAGDEPIVEWARRTATGPRVPGRVAKANAALILQRRDDATPPAQHAGQDLRGRDFTGQDLTRAVFDGADLAGATFEAAILARASFRGARLACAVLDRACLAGADLAGAELAQARLLGATLVGAAFDGARLDRAVLIGTDLRPEDLAVAASTFGAALPDVPPTAQAVKRSDVNAVAFNPDGTLLVSGHEDGTVRIWDAVASRLLRALKGHSGPVWAVAVAPDGGWIVSGGDDGAIRTWEMSTSQQTHAVEGHHGPVRAVAVAPDGGWVVTGGDDGTVRTWDTSDAHSLQTLEGHGGPVTAVAAAPDGGWVVSCGDDGAVRIWDVATGQQMHALRGHSGPVGALAVAPGGGWIVSGGDDGRLCLWNVSTGQQIHTLEGHAGPVPAVAVTPDGNQVVSGGRDGTVRVWHSATAIQVRTWKGDTHGVRAVAVSPDGGWVVSGGDDGTVQVRESTRGGQLRVLRPQGGPAVWAVAITPDGRRVVSGGDESPVRVWDISSGRELAPFKGHTAYECDAVAGGGGRSYTVHHQRTPGVRAVAVTPDGRLVVSGGNDSRLRVWDLSSGKQWRDLGYSEEFRSVVRAVTVSGDGEWVVYGNGAGALEIWDLKTGAFQRSLRSHGTSVQALAVTPDGARVISGGAHRGVQVCERETGRRLRLLKGHRGIVNAIAVAPNGSWITSGGDDGTVRIWDSETGRQLRVLKDHRGPVNAVAVAPNGSWIVSGGDDGIVRIWDSVTGQQLRILPGHRGPVNAVAVAPNGSWMISGGDDGTVRIWDAADGLPFSPELAGEAAVPPSDGERRFEASGSWWAVGLCRFEPGELDPYVPDLPPLGLERLVHGGR
ncbi:MAG: pentapeptide repeat-containing protein [Egibacteraceae bacterium]